MLAPSVQTLLPARFTSGPLFGLLFRHSQPKMENKAILRSIRGAGDDFIDHFFASRLNLHRPDSSTVALVPLSLTFTQLLALLVRLINNWFPSFPLLTGIGLPARLH